MSAARVQLCTVTVHMLLQCHVLSAVVFSTNAAADAAFSSPIEHVVLLMLENRAFDHMCGFFPNVDGLTGDEVRAGDVCARRSSNETAPHRAPPPPIDRATQ